MKRSILIIALIFVSTGKSTAQGGALGEVVRFGVNSVSDKKDAADKREGVAPALLPMLLSSSMPFFLPENESGSVKSKDVSAIDRQYAGRVVFSKTYIPREISSSKDFTNTFSFGDAIETRFFMETNIYNYYLYTPGANDPKKNAKGYYTALVIIDNDSLHPIYTGGKSFDKEVKQTNNYRAAIYSKGELKTYNNLFLVDALNNLPAGTHTIRMEIWAGDIIEAGSPRSLKPVSAGEFTLVKSEDQKLAKGRTMEDVKPGISDPQLEAAALDGLNAEARRIDWKVIFTDAIITGRDWTIIRDEFNGAILRREIEVYGNGTKSNGSCIGLRCKLSQQFQGTGYSNVFGYGSTITLDDLECGY